MFGKVGLMKMGECGLSLLGIGIFYQEKWDPYLPHRGRLPFKFRKDRLACVIQVEDVLMAEIIQ